MPLLIGKLLPLSTLSPDGYDQNAKGKAHNPASTIAIIAAP
jgi:hypothetical protein